MLNNINDCDLISEIEKLRNFMIEIGIQNGLSDPETVKVSQNLDRLLYKFERISLYKAEAS